MDLLNTNKEEKTIRLTVQCSKGTYIRSLCEDIAQKLDTVGYMKNLRRTVVGDFKIEDSITIEKLKNAIENNDYFFIMSVEKVFENVPEIKLQENTVTKYLNGVKVPLENKQENGVCRVYAQNKFIGTGIIKDNTLKRDIVL